MNKQLLGIFVISMMIGWTYGADQTWDDSTGNGLWTNAANWAGNALPGVTERATFDNTKVGNCIIDTDVTIGNYRCLSTSGTNVLLIASDKTLTVSGTAAFFFPASGSQNSNLIVSNGTLKLTGAASLYAAVGGVAVSTSSTWTVFQNTTINFDNATRLIVGYTPDSAKGKLADGILDLSGATITSGTDTNTLRLSGATADPWGLQVGRNRSTGILKLSPAVTNIEAQAFYLGGYDTPNMETSWIDLGVNPQIKRIKVNGGGPLYNCFGDFTYSDGTTTYTGLPDGMEMVIGSSATPAIFYLGFAHWVYGTPPSTLLRRSWGGFSRFAAYFDDVLIGHAQLSSPHYSSTELDLSKATVSFNNSSSEFYVKNRLGIGQFETSGSGKSDGKLRLPPSIVSLTCNSFALGGFAATNASLVQFGTNAFHTLTCKKDFYFNNGSFRHVTPDGATNDGFSASGITLKLGSAGLPGLLEVGRCNSLSKYSGEAVLTGVTNVQAYLSAIKIGQNNGTTYPSAGIVDFRGAKLDPLSVTGLVQICASGYTSAALFLSEGAATFGNVSMAPLDKNTALLWMSNLVLTVSNSFKMGKASGTACSATVTNIVAGKSSGIDLLVANTNNFVIQNTGAMRIIFQAAPIIANDHYWGLRMAGDQVAYFNQLIADGRLIWETPGLSAGSAARVRVYYDNEAGKTYLGIKPPRGTLIAIH